jgi:hypothetical protein
MSSQSHIVLLARVDDPVRLVTKATYSTVVTVEHSPNDSPAAVVEMALELAPSVQDWSRT